jgi:hypothetical protein
MGDILLVAGQPVEGFGDNDPEPAIQRILQQLLDTGPDQTRARYAAVAVFLINRPAFFRGSFAADSDLVLDGRFPLLSAGAYGRGCRLRRAAMARRTLSRLASAMTRSREPGAARPSSLSRGKRCDPAAPKSLEASPPQARRGRGEGYCGQAALSPPRGRPRPGYGVRRTRSEHRCVAG